LKTAKLIAKRMDKIVIVQKVPVNTCCAISMIKAGLLMVSNFIIGMLSIMQSSQSTKNALHKKKPMTTKIRATTKK